MSKKALSMSLARPSKAEPKEPTKGTSEAAGSRPQPAPKGPTRPTAAAARLEEGTKRIVVDVVSAVHKQVKVRAVEYSGGIKEYILRLLEADGVDLSEQPDFVPRPKGGRGKRVK
ncbi:hypothetical protein [Polyangium jinanense]|uniref:Uncharacterized protein n=1 Tax=Polyangium jinanense TaxID=2829994 RepID=A0A9X3XDL8_9BACT|nr:hypothetical protein [Polyangium jinanense]MDC3988689.1 hypothetical protein [Polyangium jinanense]